MYHYKESGLQNVWLRNGYRAIETTYGKAVAIDDLSGLHEIIALSLAMKPSRLSGTELRFLRKGMELSQASLASLLGVSAQTLALWEKSKGKITNPSEKLLRLVVRGHYKGSFAVRKMIDRLNELEQDQHDAKLIFIEQDKKWATG